MACCRRMKAAAMCCGGSCAARCAMRQLLGAREPLMHRLVWALVREMGQAYPDLVRAENLIEETLAAGRNALPQDARAGTGDSRREERRPEKGRHVRRRHRLHALRHLWLPARPDPGRIEVARHQRRSGVVYRCDGATAHQGARGVGRKRRYRERSDLVSVARKTRRHRIPRLRDRNRRGRRRRAGKGRRGGRPAQDGRERRDRA